MKAGSSPLAADRRYLLADEFVDLTIELGAEDYGTYAAFRTQKESAQYSGAADSRRDDCFRGGGEGAAMPSRRPHRSGAVPLELAAPSLNDGQDAATFAPSAAGEASARAGPGLGGLVRR